MLFQSFREEKMDTKNIRKVLVANRGEIAKRVIRACKELGVQTVAIYSKEDIYSEHRVRADEAYLVGESLSPLGAYLAIDEIVDLAKRKNVDAIHPGYGFLSENADFARACEKAGITFIGPNSEVLGKMGDKLSAKEMALACNVKTIPGSTEPLKDADEAIAKAKEYGYPIILKAASGGGGRGMRACWSEEEVAPAFELVQSEAKKAFGNDAIFIEKYLVEPKHIEVQILADRFGSTVHLHERDCSLQRRYQKVVEYTPAWSLDQRVRAEICNDAVKIARYVGYQSAGTVEFLVDKLSGQHYFIEMNPRIQVEHTVTEMVTGIDLVRAQILIADGAPLSDPMIGINSQDDIRVNGYAIQCRITTEDPSNNFAPDTGKITAYRSSGGNGVRLDSANTFVGSVISPYYDSLLVKITSFDSTFKGCVRKSLRAINETVIRGVKTNVGFIGNILTNETFQAGMCHTRFIDETPSLFNMRDASASGQPPKDGLKQLLDREGPEAVRDYVLAQKRLMITDTTMRDAHQSLLATRVRTRDMMKGADAMAEIFADAFSLEMWGGATFDTAYRFLFESPWERLDSLRTAIPNILFQMLLRGSNLLGYSSYPDNQVRAFIEQAAKSGIDVFRVFDSLNWIPNMEVAMDEVLKQNKILEATMCYTGDVLDPKRDKYTLDYYVKMAKELEKRGAHTLCIKDMSGLLKPYAARKLISTLKQEVGIPIHFHTHDTSGNQVAACIMAAEAGVDIVDLAITSMSSLTSQPSVNSVVAALQGSERDTGMDLPKLEALSEYWKDIRLRYDSFESDLKTPLTDIYRYEIPGGQYTNLRPQVKSLGLGHRFNEVREMFVTVNQMLGDIVKVTPSSKMVGDLAIFMVQNDLTPENIVEKGEALAFPDSVVSYFKGYMGQPAWGFPEDLQKVVLKGDKPIGCRPGDLLDPVDFDSVREHVAQFKSPEKITDRDLVSWVMFPKVLEDYWKHLDEYGYFSRMGSHVFFHGLAIGETNQVELADGQTLVIKYLGLGDANPEDGTRTVLFELNGAAREVTVADRTASETVRQVPMADPSDKSQVGSSIPGAVTKINVKVGDTVEENQVLAIVEAMKMETSVTARMSGVVEEILTEPNKTVKAGQLLIRLR